MTNKREMIPVFRPSYGREEIETVSQVLKSGWIGLGPETAKFEKQFASYVGSRYAVALNSGTAALHLALMQANIGPGDEVVLPALTFVSTAHAVMYVGARPVFADVRSDTLCICMEDVARKITPKTRAIIPVHYGGHPCDMEELQQLVSRKNITIIEDAAHACGSSYRGQRIGNISKFTCFSFHAVKNLATGDGGMITTNSEEDFKCLMQLRWMGITKDTWGRLEKVTMPNESSQKGYGWYYEVQELGYKYHMNDLASALGLVQLSKLEANNNRRRELAKIYTGKFSDISEIECPEVIPDVITAQHNYVIRCDKRDELHLFLREHNISSGVHYMPIHLQPFYRRLFPDVSLPMTEKQWIRLLTLPLFPDMSQNEQAYIIDCIRKFAK